MTAGSLDRAYASGIVPEGQRWASDFTYRPSPPPDSLTVLKALSGRALAKRVHPDGKIVDYDRAARFDMVRCHFRNLDDIEVQLRWLAGQPDRCIVRGAIASGKNVELDVPRWLHARDNGPATIAEAPRRWLAVDVENFPDEAMLRRAERRISRLAGAEHHLSRAVEPGDLVGAAWVTTSCLPPEFYAVDCLVQATGSHGLKAGLRVRLWFMLDRAITADEAKFWLRNAPVDPSVFGANQPIFTAKPIFTDSAVDPVPERLVRVIGRPEVPLPPEPDLRPKPRPQRTKPREPENGVSPLGKAALKNAEDVILSAGRGRQDPTLIKQAYRIGRVVADGHLPKDFARKVLFHIGSRLPSLDPAWTWTTTVVEDKITRAFDVGIEGGRHA